METQSLTAAQRVAQLIKSLDITAYQFCKETGLSQQTISNVMTGKNRPSLDTLEAIARRYPTSASWLLTGKAEQRPIDGPSAVTEFIKEAQLTRAPLNGLDADPVQALQAETDTLLKLAVAEAKLAEKDQQIADKDKLIEKLWTLNGLPAKLGKLMSSSDAALARFISRFVHQGQAAEMLLG